MTYTTVNEVKEEEGLLQWDPVDTSKNMRIITLWRSLWLYSKQYLKLSDWVSTLIDIFFICLHKTNWDGVLYF